MRSSRTMNWRSMAVVLVLTLAASACSDASTRSAAAERLAVEILVAELESDPDKPMTAGDARCFAEGVVGELGVAGLVGAYAEMTAAEIDAEIDVVLDIIFECFDVVALVADDIAAEGMVSRSTAECIATTLHEAGIVRAVMRTAMVLGAGGFVLDDMALAEEHDDTVMEAMLECATPEEIAAVMRAESGYRM